MLREPPEFKGDWENMIQSGCSCANGKFGCPVLYYVEISVFSIDELCRAEKTFERLKGRNNITSRNIRTGGWRRGFPEAFLLPRSAGRAELLEEIKRLRDKM